MDKIVIWAAVNTPVLVDVLKEMALNLSAVLDNEASSVRGILDKFADEESALPSIVIMEPFLEDKGAMFAVEPIRKRRIPVIILSGPNDSVMELSLYKKGINDFICAPFNIKIICHKIRAIINYNASERND